MNLCLTVYSHRTLTVSAWVDSKPVLYAYDPEGPREARAVLDYEPYPQPPRNAHASHK